jgi:hypothetical protein
MGFSPAHDPNPDLSDFAPVNRRDQDQEQEYLDGENRRLRIFERHPDGGAG